MHSMMVSSAHFQSLHQHPIGIPSHHIHRRAIYTARRIPICHATPASDSGLGGGGNNGNSGGDGDGGGGGDGNKGPWSWLPFVTLKAGALATIGTVQKQKHKSLRAIDTTTPVSIIVPALNESKGISDAIAYLRSLDPGAAEIIVADGGSTDATARLARKAGAKVVRTRRGRARQMNTGAEAVKKKDGIFLFVHSDSRPPRDAVALVRVALSDPGIILGGFRTSIESDGDVLRFPTFHLFIKTYYAPLIFAPLQFIGGLRCMFGDQSLFCRAKDFWRIGGFDSRLPIMEDADLCVRMHKERVANGKLGKEVQLHAVNRTSGRRIGEWGNFKSTMIQARVALAWWLGATPEELWNIYDKLYTDAFR